MFLFLCFKQRSLCNEYKTAVYYLYLGYILLNVAPSTASHRVKWQHKVSKLLYSDIFLITLPILNRQSIDDIGRMQPELFDLVYACVLNKS